MTFALTRIQPPQPRERVLLARPRIDAALREAPTTREHAAQ